MSESIPASNNGEDKPALETKHRRLLMSAVMGVSICQLLDVTIANVALPHMQSSLGASLDSITWVLTSFIIAGVMVTPIVGWTSDRLGSRRVFLWAVAGFLVASMLCGMATSLTQMVIFRALQGICAAFIGPMAQTIMYDINPPSKQPTAMSIWGMVVMIAPITGPMLGGLLTDTLNWRWVFYINLPVGIPTFLILLWLLPSRPIIPRKLDQFGFLVLALGLVALQLLLDRGQHKDWFQSPEIVIELVVVLSALWIFAVHTMNTKNPLFPADLLKNSNFVGALVIMFVLGIANIAIASTLPTMFQTVYQYNVFDTGLLMIPRGVGVLITMLIVARLMRKMDVRFCVCCGYLLASIALWFMSRWSLDMDYWPILITGFIQGLGMGLIFTPVNMAAFSTLEPRFRPDGSSLLNLVRNLGGSFGISVIITLLGRNAQTSHADLSPHITAYSLTSFDLSATAARLGEYGSALLHLIEAEINRQALMIAHIDNFYAMSVVIAIIALVPFFLQPIKLPAVQQPGSGRR